jgi:CheY-like chemotaxis protein
MAFLEYMLRFLMHFLPPVEQITRQVAVPGQFMKVPIRVAKSERFGIWRAPTRNRPGFTFGDSGAILEVMQAKAQGESCERGSVSDSTLRATLLLLHIDDSPDDRALFRLACEQAALPIQCQPVESAAKALSYFDGLIRESKVQPVTWPDLVLLDLIMPGGTGFEILRYIRRTPELEKIPVVTFTGDVNPEIKDEAYRLGANSCLRKPLVFDQMVQVAKTLYEAWSLAQRPSAPS